MKKDKQRVESENWDDARLESFLDLKSYDDTDVDYMVLEKAYRAMPLPLFERFLKIFVNAGRNVNAQNPKGETILAVIKKHPQSEDYAKAIENL
mgnify:CR=1 FL=1